MSGGGESPPGGLRSASVAASAVASAGVSPSVAGADIDRDPMTNKYTCSRCGRSYLHQATLVRHQRYECGISASYPCPLCGRKFKVR